jgi:putative endonuclease
MAEWSVSSRQSRDERDLVPPKAERTEGIRMKFWLYILFSEKFGKTYVGQTANLNKRLVLHNSGRVKSTKRYLPWKLIHSECLNSRSDAMAREEWYKSPAGRKNISKLL